MAGLRDMLTRTAVGRARGIYRRGGEKQPDGRRLGGDVGYGSPL